MAPVVLDFKRCDGCGSHIPATSGSCPSCGQRIDGIARLISPGRALSVGAPPLLALLVLFVLPDGAIAEPAGSLVEAGVLGAGFAPLVVALAWFFGVRRRREPSSYAARMDEAEARLEELEQDLRSTESRIRAARRDLREETRPRLVSSLRAEIAQDRRLQDAQARLTAQLEHRLQQLAVERFRGELVYFEACRDALDSDAEAAPILGTKIRELERQLGDDVDETWSRALEDAHALHHQLARGVERLRAARRLDPLLYADLTETDETEEPASEGDLSERIEHHLERIALRFDALDELGQAMRSSVPDAEGSGMRVRVDEELFASLEDEEEELPFDPEARISVTGI